MAPLYPETVGGAHVSSRRFGDGMVSFAAPPLIRSGASSPQERAEAAAFLRIPPEAIVEAAWIDNGPGWLGVRLATAAGVLAVEPELS